MQVDLVSQDIDLLLDLLQNKHNELTAQWAWRAVTATQRKRIADLQKRLGLVRGLMK